MTDPYTVLGVPRTASDAELRAAYRRAVQREHPDHNGGAPEAARRFEAVQQAYAEVRSERASAGANSLDDRLAAMEREVSAARSAREQALRAAREARARAARQAREAAAAAADRDPGSGERPSDEELGYVKTEDSFAKIFADAAASLVDHLSEARDQLSDARDQLSEARRRRGAP